MSKSGATFSGGLVGRRRVELRSSITASEAFLPMVAGRAPACQTNSISCKTTGLRPVEVFLVSVVVDSISQFSGAVAEFAGAVLPGVHPCASALRAEDWIVLVHGYFDLVSTLCIALQHMKAQKPEATHPTSDMIGSLKI